MNHDCLLKIIIEGRSTVGKKGERKYRKEILNNVEDRISCLRRTPFVIDVNCGTQGEKG
jgi:hypothetical protein